ncbi:uncharacterized protein LOC105801252 [Gossypium raimondii]|uniref:uncharacterized protein LOC105801252 n=1 Tax=Gossypium raimondii TaxID=29730 RepID=UPI00063A94BE|nr:uncharacterized protein LOC105801252 [Gossypium raimondii]
MQMLTTRSETLRMQNSKTIGEFYIKICDLSNQAFALGEEYSNTKLVRKDLRSLPERFSTKVTTIEKAKDLESLIIDEFISSLQIFEMNLNEAKCNRTEGENITLQVGKEVPTSYTTAIK